MISPLPINRLQQHLFLDLAHGVGTKSDGFLGHSLICGIAEAFAHHIVINAFFIAPVNHRHIQTKVSQQGRIETFSIPLIGIRFWRHVGVY